MSSATLSPDTTAIDGSDGLPTDDTSAATGAELEVAQPVLIGDIVTGPVHLNVGEDQNLPPIRAGWVDARTLYDNPRNPRRNPRDIDDLRASVAEVGVLVPLVLIDRQPPALMLSDDPVEAAEQIRAVNAESAAQAAADPGFTIFMGHRRKYAAIETGRYMVPCWLVPDEGAAHQIMGMLLENGHRAGLTPMEEAEAYHQLTLEGLTAEEIAKVRAISTDEVRTALRARELPKLAQHALNEGTFTIEQAMALEEFKDNPRATERLLGELDNEWRFKQALAAEREKRNFALARERAKAELVLAGVKSTSRPKGFGTTESTAVDVGQLVDADGRDLDVEQVKKLPGFAAFVEKDGATARTVVYCEDPAALGYTRRPQPARPGMSAEQLAAEQEQQQREDEFRDALVVAATVRHEFLCRTYGTAKGARKLAVEAMRAAALRQNMGRSADFEDLYTALGGSDAEVLRTAGEDRLRRSLVAAWVCRQEYNLSQTLQRYQYSLDKPAAAAWLERLVDARYPLSDAEATLYDSLKPPPAANDQDTDEQADTEPTGTLQEPAGEDDEPADNSQTSETQPGEDHEPEETDHQAQTQPDGVNSEPPAAEGDEPGGHAELSEQEPGEDVDLSGHDVGTPPADGIDPDDDATTSVTELHECEPALAA
ncbi:ParB/RepB/Spo0J family partition protein [Actinoplanes aureus]|uniref:ParB/Spo0J HTH domain-containing protein n=1 Tax=Actinoplanes aureus TaxID=2792083 RepID=A0A931CIV1_9ACTN|nr:hypothetical protein [Actinoplanes aureus]MBG0568802.1 hypothetical protein [Actinoplanes aureus]